MNKIINDIVKEGQEKRPELETDIIDIIFRKLSKYMSFLLIKLKFTPNFVSILAIIFTIIGGIVLARGDYLLSAFFFFLFLLFDYCDGEMARAMKMNSISGHYLDYSGHFIMFASFMIGLTFSIYQYHPTSLYLLLGLSGVAGILLRSIVKLLISEVIVRENLRFKRQLPMSNQEGSYTIKAKILDSPNINPESASLMKKIGRIVIRPTGGDDLLFFYLPFSIIIYIFPFPIFHEWHVRIVDIYFFYLCLINLILPFILIYLNVCQKKAEIYYNDTFGN